MYIKIRLILMSFLQFFIWGAWLTTAGNYWFANHLGSGMELGAVFSTLGISSLLMPALMGIVADKWIAAEKLYAILHLLAGICIACIPQVHDPYLFFWVILGAMLCYMPTISLSNAIAYTILKEAELDVIRDFPPIRVWGTIGFIAAMWFTDLSGSNARSGQFYISAVASGVLALYAWTLPACPPTHTRQPTGLRSDVFGLKAFRLFAHYRMALFFIFSVFLGAALQLTNMYGVAFLNDFSSNPVYTHLLVMRYPTIIMSASQISETLFILAIPFFLRRLGIKRVMLVSMVAWFLRFGLFAYGNPGNGLWMILLSNIVYGMAFDFFNISGSLFVETHTDPDIRSSAQGVFMMMTNGLGAMLGSTLSGYLIDHYYTVNNTKQWPGIWTCFALYALAVAIAFQLLFRYKHDRISDNPLTTAH